MQLIRTDHAGGSRLRLVFDSAVVSLGLAPDATFEDIASMYDEISNRRFGDPVAIEVTLSAPSRAADLGS